MYLHAVSFILGKCRPHRADIPLPWFPRICVRLLVYAFTCQTVILTTYLKNMVGNSFHFLVVDPALLITPICTSSMISIAATGIPARNTLEAAAAASRIVGKVTTATLVSWGTTASFKVISVTMPSVPSEPTKRLVRL